MAAGFLERLPRGRTLPPDVWATRHRIMVRLVWLHALGLLIFGLARGYGLPHSLVEIVPVAGFAIIAASTQLGQRARAGAVALGLLTSSAMLVHLWDGQIEAHFHFFVAVAILAAYEEWSTYLLAIGYVAVHHGAAGLLDAGEVFDHPAGNENPLEWAIIHALFVGALAVANVVSWRLNEDVREDMRASEGRFRSAFDDAPIGMAIVAADGRIVRVNEQMAARSGYSAAELQEMRLAELLAPEEREGLTRWPEASTDGAEERRFVRRDGTAGWALWQHSRLSEEDDHAAEGAFITHVIDISQRKQAERQLDHQAHHDPLTGLPNRKLFLERLDETLAQTGDDEAAARAAVLFVDLDNFKTVNDSLGHDAGDRLLAALAQRMRRVLRPDDLLARFGGDEFAVLVRGVGGATEAKRVAERLAGAMRAPVVLDGDQRFVTASIGICVAERRAGETLDAYAVMRDADAAMYRAKELGKARADVFDDSLRAEVVERYELESALRGAEERGELRLDYQPLIDLHTGHITGVEALLRWDHPELGTIAPLRFIPIAEQCGLIVPIGAWVLHAACRQAAEWGARSEAGAQLEVAVNVSPRQLAFAAFADEVAHALKASGLPPHRLCLEVTESAVVADLETATASLERLKKLGVRLALDDFGVGYASLSQLKALPSVDVLKIDRSFVDGVLADDEDKAIVEAVVQLAASLGLETVAEGVESSDQASVLRDMRCSLAQGFHFARPVSPDAIAELLERQRLGELTV
ncbi:MAG TPA: EAL domain-containing protein [Solirubrobacteraceae bacterium]|nr:EAL domain-containing protein [Solirubrobacteraceae bacterium]